MLEHEGVSRLPNFAKAMLERVLNKVLTKDFYTLPSAAQDERRPEPVRTE